MALRVLFIIDPLDPLISHRDSGLALMRAADAAGQEVWAATATEVGLSSDGRPHCACRRLLDLGADEVDWQRADGPHRQYVDSFNAVMIRTDPPFDQTYLNLTYLLDRVDRSRTVIVNEPAGVRNWNEKLAVLRFPELVPPTFVTASPADVVDRVRQVGRAVLKPLNQCGGQGVLQVAVDDPNLISLARLCTGDGHEHVIVQDFLPAAAIGDKRIYLLDGKPLGALHRRATGTEFRHNVALGADALATELTSSDWAICAVVGPAVRAHGIALAGVDVIGDRLIEVNVTSPAGLREIDRLYGTDPTGQIMAWVAAKAMARIATSVPAAAVGTGRDVLD